MRTRAPAFLVVVITVPACGRAPADTLKDAFEDASSVATGARVDASRDVATAATDDGLDAVEASPPDEEPLAGARYAPARAFVARYCAECHTERGAHAKKKRALPQQRLDTYEQWRSHASVLRGVIDKWHPDGKTMPLKGATAMPRDDERRLMLDWLARGSPNTEDGR